jgi:hypothetical protein
VRKEIVWFHITRHDPEEVNNQNRNGIETTEFDALLTCVVSLVFAINIYFLFMRLLNVLLIYLTKCISCCTRIYLIIMVLTHTEKENKPTTVYDLVWKLFEILDKLFCKLYNKHQKCFYQLKIFWIISCLSYFRKCKIHTFEIMTN